MPNPVPAVSHVEALAATFLPQLRPAERGGLALWVVALLVAESCCERTILTKLAPLGYAPHALWARLREWLCDGADRAAPCATSLDVEACFAPLLGWLLAWWGGPVLPLAIDATSLRGRVVVLAVSVLYRGCAIPVAWVVLPHRGKGLWLPHLERLLTLLAPAVPTGMTVLVMTDRGLWSPALWRHIRENGWHPLLRIRPDATFAPAGQRRQQARALVPGAGWCWVGEGVAYKEKAKRLSATLLVVWGEGQKEPWLLLTDLAPDEVGVSWYGLRVWIELGFRALKSMGWHWERTRRTDPARIARHWLVLAVATLLDVAVGTRLEEADWRGVPPGRLRRAHPAPGARAHHERVRPRAGLAARPGAARHPLVGVVAAARSLARPARRPDRHPSYRHSRRRLCVIPPPLRLRWERGDVRRVFRCGIELMRYPYFPTTWMFWLNGTLVPEDEIPRSSRNDTSGARHLLFS